MTEDRDKWRKYIHGVANSRIEDSWQTEQNKPGEVMMKSIIAGELQ